MNKRTLMTLAALAAATVALGGAKSASSLPNIIYILCDDLGYGDVGICNPDGKIPTPNMDRLGREGMVFTDAHSGSAVCTPTRYGVLTGRYAWRTRMKSGVLSGYSNHLIEEGRMTVASLLKENGYHTAYIGKWHLGWDWVKTGDAEPGKGLGRITPVDYTQPIQNGPKENGFIYSFGHCASLDIPPYVYVENGMPTAVPDRETFADKKEVKNGWWRKGPTAPDFDHWDVLPNFTRRAVKYVEQQARTDKPFFLYLPYSSPHTPVLPTSEYKGKSGIDSAYADFTYMNDDCIGQVMKAVEKAGIADNTIIIVTSDNGCSPEADFEELKMQGHNPSAIYRGHKADIFEGGHRVPFIVRWPAKVKAGTVCTDTTCLTDMLATCAEIVGAKLPADAGEDSVSMLPNLLGTATGSLREATVHHSVNGTFAIRQGKWKLIDAPHSGGWSTPRPGKDKELYKDLPLVQLYDMESDPGETINVQDQHPEVVDRLKALLEKYKNDGRSICAD
ncbi:sulfatase family protein [Pontiella sulfatireligans]|uniref:Arylsulfatase n=1 Tax=Pontiella sulfatireligans TaxID=2750658 RepID=A0A6C2UFN1_9BACT|nr:arylsulfatase [Pontiella sulfatireligans]SPS74222.1 sulfatase S1_15 [Kiritimatiellales bacterium]VGO18683.1 Arylsulfatase [Pontiella sulfatireligans]